MLNKAQKDSLLYRIRQIVDGYRDDKSDTDVINCHGVDVAVIIIHSDNAADLSNMVQDFINPFVHANPIKKSMGFQEFREDNDLSAN